MKLLLYILLPLFLISFRAEASPRDTITLSWLNGEPLIKTGVSWGVPWPKGTVKKGQSFSLITSDGKYLPLQSWPLAYWPDGSLKWTGFATVADNQVKGSLKLIREKAPAKLSSAIAKEKEDAFDINTGNIKCRIPKNGNYILDSLINNNNIIATHGRLVCSTENHENSNEGKIVRIENFTSNIQKVTIEQNGPVRSVIKIEGIHKSDYGKREWLPFVVRFYFYAGLEQIRMIHTFIFDGNEHEDFIHRLGISFSVPMREQVQNRHVRFSGEGNGLWAEPIQPLKGRERRIVLNKDTVDAYPDQIAGKRVPNKEDVDQLSQNFLNKWAVWSDFKLVQPNASGFTIEKRTNNKSCWLPAGAGKRSSGLVYVGDVSGGLAVSLKNFWQSYPASLEIKNAAGKNAELNVWLWSPDAPSMDLRHYDTIAHGLEEVYEDVQPGFNTPQGIARTSELTLFACSDVPAKIETSNQAITGSCSPLLVCSPQYLHSVKAFGIWSLPDKTTPFKKAIEDQLDGAINYYKKSIDQHNWYGFWDYGDVMHSYDDIRHVWRYDLGGMAWDNSELGTDMWLWYSFLRTGRADIFRMAEAMTRHTGEVDCYHLGRFAGLGSRHNVRHWGCGAKEARISQAAYRRFYYYLTTDERTGDIMRETVNADFKAAEYDPMRLAQPATEAEKKYPGRVRIGPDWFAFAGNWMTEWERTGDKKYRDKIISGIESILKMSYWLRSGHNLVFGYDPSSGKLFQLNDEAGDYNLATIMGGAEVIFELNEFIDHPEWQKAWLQFCRLTYAPADILIKDKKTGTEGRDSAYARPDRLAAYAYMKTKDPVYAKQALSRLYIRPEVYNTKKIEGPQVLNPIDEAPKVSTNGTAQSLLIAIEVLEMCADQLPESVPKFNPQDFQRSNPNRQFRKRNNALPSRSEKTPNDDN